MGEGTCGGKVARLVNGKRPGARQRIAARSSRSRRTGRGSPGAPEWWRYPLPTADWPDRPRDRAGDADGFNPAAADRRCSVSDRRYRLAIRRREHEPAMLSSGGFTWQAVRSAIRKLASRPHGVALLCSDHRRAGRDTNPSYLPGAMMPSGSSAALMRSTAAAKPSSRAAASSPIPRTEARYKG